MTTLAEGGPAVNQAYHVEAWREFYVMLGGSLAALTGLLFRRDFSAHLVNSRRSRTGASEPLAIRFRSSGCYSSQHWSWCLSPIQWLGIELMVFNFFMLNFIIVEILILYGEKQMPNCLPILYDRRRSGMDNS